MTANARSSSAPMTTRSGFMKSSTAAPCFKNSGLLTTLKDCVVSAATTVRHLAAVERCDLGSVLVDADHRVSVLGEARTDHEADVPRADNGDFHFTIRY